MRSVYFFFILFACTHYCILVCLRMHLEHLHALIFTLIITLLDGQRFHVTPHTVSLDHRSAPPSLQQICSPGKLASSSALAACPPARPAPPQLDRNRITLLLSNWLDGEGEEDDEEAATRPATKVGGQSRF